MKNRKIRIGTRGSRLALWQAHAVEAALNKGGAATEIVIIETKGDKVLDVTIGNIGGKGVFTEEIEQQLALGTIDIAVHSAKDMPSELPEGMELIAFPEREKSHDVLAGDDKRISLKSGEPLLIGTSSTRRAAILKHYYPHVKTVAVRGNLQTRIRKMREGQCDVLMLAYAGMRRLGYDDMIVEELDGETFIPAAGQGAIAVEASTNLDRETYDLVRRFVNHAPTETCVKAERAFLRTLHGGCSIPVFVAARLENSSLHISGGVISLDGGQIATGKIAGDQNQPDELGSKLGEDVLARGGREILEQIRGAR